MPTYEQNKKSIKNYLDKQDEIRVRMSKESGLKADVQNHIGITGESMNVFVLRAIRETMARDQSRNVTLDGEEPTMIQKYLDSIPRYDA